MTISSRSTRSFISIDNEFGRLEVEMKSAILAAFLGFSMAAVAQSGGKAEVFTSADVHGQLVQLTEQAKAKGSSGSTLGEYGTHAIKLSERTVSGGAEIHAHFDDVMLVMEGRATLITGGTLIDPHSGSNGETTGSGIRDGATQSLAPGDVVHVPAGTPHQIIVPPGTIYSAMVIKIKE
jgi:mannose-6-phosphate isomerase-like protein (cupin superfamily)